MFYLAVYIIIVILSLLEIEDGYKKLRHQLAFIVLIGLLLIAGLRFETGIDWLQYTNDFKNVKGLNSIRLEDIFEEINFGFLFVSSFVKTIGGDIQLLFFIMQLLVAIFLWKSLIQFTEFKLLSLLIYFSLLFFHLDMNLMKQAVSVSVFFFSIRFIVDKKLIKFSVFTLLSFSFHWSGILFFPLYFIINRRYSTLLLSTLVVFFVLFYTFNLSTGKLVYNLSNLVFGSESQITEKALFYTTFQVFSIQRFLSLGFVANLLIVFVTLYYRKKLSGVIKHFDVFLNLMIIQLFFYFIMYEYIELSGRLRFYTLFSYIIILPYFISIFKPIADRLIVFALIVLYSFSYVYIYMGSSVKTISYNPYQNYLIHKMFDKESNGKERLNKYIEEFRKERKEKSNK